MRASVSRIGWWVSLGRPKMAISGRYGKNDSYTGSPGTAETTLPFLPAMAWYGSLPLASRCAAWSMTTTSGWTWLVLVAGPPRSDTSTANGTSVPPSSTKANTQIRAARHRPLAGGAPSAAGTTAGVRTAAAETAGRRARTTETRAATTYGAMAISAHTRYSEIVENAAVITAKTAAAA